MDKELLSIILMIVLIFTILLLININNNSAIRGSIKRKMLRDLEKIHNLMEQKNEIMYRDLIIRLDSILSKTLQLKFNNKNSCGENLKKSKEFFKKDIYNKLWEAHKFRNRVVHEDADVSFKDLEKTYKIVKEGIERII